MPSIPDRERIAFLEKVFLKPHQAGTPLRGVELFNLQLLRELDGLGYDILFPVESSWADVVGAELKGASSIRIRSVGFGSVPLFCGLLAARAIAGEARRGGTFPTLLLGNVANGLIPALAYLRMAESFRALVLVAHRETSQRFLRAIRALPGHIVCVCKPIENGFRGAVRATTHTDYGVLNADAFHPGEPKPDDSRPIRFCVLGALDNAWKGADTATEAFRLLPDEIRKCSELHLAAYRTPPVFPDEPGIIPHGWSPASTMPDFLRSMDVLLVPSRDEEVMRETFSQATVQGMLTGLPVIHTSRPILVEKFDRGGGIRADTPAEFAAAMQNLAADSALRRSVGEAARRTALERYVWNTRRFAERYLKPAAREDRP